MNSDGSDAVADRVIYKDNVRGPVESIAVTSIPQPKRSVVLGQTVIINVITKFKEHCI